MNHNRANARLETCRVAAGIALLIFGTLDCTAKTNDAISREVSIFNFGQPSDTFEAISREVSVFNRGLYTFDAISREASAFNYGPNRLGLTIGTTALRAGDSGGVPVTLF